MDNEMLLKHLAEKEKEIERLHEKVAVLKAQLEAWSKNEKAVEAMAKAKKK